MAVLPLSILNRHLSPCISVTSFAVSFYDVNPQSEAPHSFRHKFFSIKSFFSLGELLQEGISLFSDSRGRVLKRYLYLKKCLHQIEKKTPIFGNIFGGVLYFVKNFWWTSVLWIRVLHRGKGVCACDKFKL